MNDDGKNCVKPSGVLQQTMKRLVTTNGTVLTASKVLHLTETKSSIKTEIENELSLHKFFDNFKQALATTAGAAIRKMNKTGQLLKGKGNIFIDYYSTPDPKKHVKNFCPAAKKCLVVTNGGGKSAIPSEALCIQYFFERFSAKNFLLEMEVDYEWKNWKIVDTICKIYGHNVGISTSRAMLYPNPKKTKEEKKEVKEGKVKEKTYTDEDAHQLLKKKLYGLVMARDCVSEKHAFNICFLHIFCETGGMAEKLKKVYPRVIEEDDTGTFSEVIILATVYTDPWIYNKNIRFSN
jgi:hypothetical protein